jgi:hypothetical protein
MAMKCWRLKVKGERPLDEIQSTIGRSGGSLLRVHFEGGETHVYFAAEKSVVAEAAKAMKDDQMPREVSARALTKLG